MTQCLSLPHGKHIERGGRIPQVIVKMRPGPSEQQQRRLAEQIVENVVTTLKSADESVSVYIEEVKPNDWLGRVIGPRSSR